MSLRGHRRPRVAEGADDRRVVESHRLRHRLPSNRAVVGGLLVAIAAAGVFVAHRSATTPPSSRYLVVTRPVEPGATLASGDLGTVALDLPDDLAVVDADDLDAVLGRTVAVRLDELDLLRPDDLYDAGRFTGADTVELAIELPAARALDGTIATGDAVDVLSTDPAGTGTSTVAERVRVTGVTSPDGSGIGADGNVVVRLGVPDRETAELVTDAAVRTDVTLALPAPGGPGDEERPT